MSVILQHKTGTSTQWTSSQTTLSSEPILAKGEIGYDTTVNKIKIGDGTTLWGLLPYVSGAGALIPGGTAGQILAKIDSVDYNTEWIDNYTTDVRQTVLNQTGTTLYKGQAVYISNAGNSSDTPRVVLAKADVESTSSKTLGLVYSDIANGSTGFVIKTGLLTGIVGSNVDAGSATIATGDPVWLSPTTAGGLIFGLTNKPIAPNHLVYLGTVVKISGSSNSNIWISVTVQNGFELNEIHSVLIGTDYSSVPSDKDLLAYESSSNLWKNKSFSTLGIGTVTSVSMTVPTGLSISGTPITTSGTLALTLSSGYYIPGAATNISTTGNISTTSTGTITSAGLLTASGGAAITTSITTPSTSFSIANTTATTLNIGGAATTINVGAATGTTTVNNNLTVKGQITGDTGTLPYAMMTGTVSVTGSGVNSASATITNLSSKFTVAPLVFATMAGGTTSFIASVGTVTSTSIQIIVAARDASSTYTSTQTVNWVAIQMTSGASAG